MRYVEQVKQLVLHRLQNEAAKVYLFGSWARGTQHQGSDVDVAIKFKHKDTANAMKIEALREALEESTIPYTVDIVDMDNASDRLLEDIFKDGIVWN